MIPAGQPVERPNAQREIDRWLGLYGQLSLGDESWAHRTFADLVRSHGQLYLPSPWTENAELRPGRCFEAATHWSEERGWTYVEGFALMVPGLDPFACFDHAWCVRDDDTVADPALDHESIVAYFGIPLTADFRRAQQRLRETVAVLTADPENFLAGAANLPILQFGLPAEALARR